MVRFGICVVTIFWSLVLLSAGSSGATDSRLADDPVTAIETDYQAGQLSLDEKALLQVTAIRHPDQLPDKYRRLIPSSGRLLSRSATLAIRDIRLQWDALLPETRQSINLMLPRPTAIYTYVSPSGFFLLHYNLAGFDAVSAEDLDTDGVPDYVERIAAYCDTSLDVHRTMGYRDPPSDGTLGGDGKYDVYFLSMEYYGYADPEGLGSEPWNDYYSYLVLHNNFLGFPPNTDPEGNPAGAAKATAAHEFHHAVQFAYDAGDLGWFMELDATYMEDIVYDQVNDNYNYLPTFMTSPETSLMKDDIHKYSTFIYGLYLARTVDTALMVSIWDGARYKDVFQSLSDTLAYKYGVSRDTSFVDFAMWNFVTGERDDSLHYEEGAYYPLVGVAGQHSYYPVYETWAPGNPAGYAASYIQFFPTSQSGELRLTFNGADSARWGAGVIVSSSPNDHQFLKISLTPATYEGSISIPDFKNLYCVTLAAVNLKAYGTASSYLYSASIGDPLLLSTQLLTDTIFCAGRTTVFDFEAANGSPTGEVVRYTAWDNLGWIAPDTLEHYIPPDSSETASFNVQPPVGTALGTLNGLYFKAWFADDPAVYQYDAKTGEVVPERGDVNYDGRVNLSDVTKEIGYVYLGGEAPIPLWSGDYNCSGAANLSDITAIINRVYLGGPHSPCDPY